MLDRTLCPRVFRIDIDPFIHGMHAWYEITTTSFNIYLSLLEILLLSCHLMIQIMSNNFEFHFPLLLISFLIEKHKLSVNDFINCAFSVRVLSFNVTIHPRVHLVISIIIQTVITGLYYIPIIHYLISVTVTIFRYIVIVG